MSTQNPIGDVWFLSLFLIFVRVAWPRCTALQENSYISETHTLVQPLSVVQRWSTGDQSFLPFARARMTSCTVLNELTERSMCATTTVSPSAQQQLSP